MLWAVPIPCMAIRGQVGQGVPCLLCCVTMGWSLPLSESWAGLGCEREVAPGRYSGITVSSREHQARAMLNTQWGSCWSYRHLYKPYLV